jgi:hypothetical protein
MSYLYACGIVIAPQGGAFVVVEKCPRKRRGVRLDRYGEDHAFEEWEDVLKIVWAERLTGPLVAQAERVAGLLTSEPLHEDCSTYLDVGATGQSVLQLFNDRRAWPHALVIGGEAPPHASAVTAPTLHTTTTLALEQKRLEALEALSDASALMRLLAETAMLPETGPMADLARAAMIAVWNASQYQTRGPWASSKPPKPGTLAYYELQAIETRKHMLAAAKRQAERLRGRWGGRWDQ